MLVHGAPCRLKSLNMALSGDEFLRLEDLVKAKRVASQMGGIDRALAALNALEGFEG